MPVVVLTDLIKEQGTEPFPDIAGILPADC